MNLLFLLLLFAGCKEHSSWSTQHLEGAVPPFKGAKLSYRNSTDPREMRLEFCKTEASSQLFLLLPAGAIPSEDQESKYTLATLFTKEHKSHFTAYVREGGERVLAPYPLYQAVLDHLESGTPFSLQCGKSRLFVDPKLFNKTSWDKKPFEIPIFE